jgi:HSP20 family protein
MAASDKTKAPARRTPFGDLEDMRESMRSLFDFRWPFSTLAPSRLFAGFERQPAVDMFERDGNVVVKVEMPGIDPDKIDVSVSDNELRISGERAEEKEIREENYYRSERTYGHIYRSLTLPEGCDTSSIDASAKDGVLEVVIPKRASAASKKVEVKKA